MNNKLMALAVVGVMLSVCMVGVVNYTDDTSALTKNNGKYDLGTVQLSELKDKAVVYFNLSYDKQFVNIDPTVVISYTDNNTPENKNYLSATDGKLEEYRYSVVLKVDNFPKTDDVDVNVKFEVTITYTADVDKYNNDTDYILTETEEYDLKATIKAPVSNPAPISMEFQGNVAYNGNWTKENSSTTYKGSETGDTKVIFVGSNASFYSNNLPAGLYLKEATEIKEDGSRITGATIVGMLGSGVTSGSFDVYTVTETDVTKTTVNYSVKDATPGSGFTYSVFEGSTPIIESANANKTILVKSGTDLIIRTNEKLTDFKVTNAINGKAYTDVNFENNTTYDYKISGSTFSGTVKVFMTYNNGINDNRTLELTIIYIGSPSDASLVEPVVRSY